MGTVKQTFNYTGANQTYLVPIDTGGVVTVTLKGGGDGFASGGAGGYVQGILAVTPGQTLNVFVGGAGGAPSGVSGGTPFGGTGGWPNGGAGGTNTAGSGYGGYGGGGESSIRVGGTGLPSRVVVAGGAGGTGRGGFGFGSGGVGGNGGAGTGASGTNPSQGSATGGAGGTQSAGGAGGTGSLAGGAGALGNGGTGTNSAGASAESGGGGGGGYYGGGAGGNQSPNTIGGSGGGGGGSNYTGGLTAVISNTRGGGGAAGANGQVIIEYTPTPQAPALLSPTSPSSLGVIQALRVNLAPNPLMNGTYFNWLIYNSTITSVVQNNGQQIKSSVNSGRISWKQNTGINTGRAWTNVSGLSVGKTYGVRCWVYSDSVTGDAPKVRLHQRGADWSLDSKPNTKFNTWQELTMTFVATGSSQNIDIINDTLIKNTASTRYVYFTQFQVELTDSLDEFQTEQPFFAGNSPGATWTGTAGNSPSQLPAIINPDYSITFHWTYVADQLNNGIHYKSLITYSYDNVTYNRFPDFNEVALYSRNNGDEIIATIPASHFQAGQTIYIKIQDMNNWTNGWGPAALLILTSATRPATPVWTSHTAAVGTNPATWTYNAVSNLPIRIAWTAVPGQHNWRVKQLRLDLKEDFPIWDSGWMEGSANAGIIMPRNRVGKSVLMLYVYNGVISSAGSPIAINLAANPVIDTDLVPKERIELSIYDGQTGAFIDRVPQRIDPTFLEELRGPGAGSFKIRLDDPSWLRSPNLINPRNLVYVREGPRYIGVWIITGHEPTIVDTGEGAAEAVVVKGQTPYGVWFGDAVLYPESTIADFGISTPRVVRQQRAFGVMSAPTAGHWYDATKWTFCTFETLVNSNTVPDISNPNPNGNPWRRGPSNWPAELNVSTQWSWSSDQRAHSFPGTVVFKQQFQAQTGQDFPAPVRLYLAADDEAQAFLNGMPWAYNNNWQEGTQSEDWWVSSAGYDITIVAAQGQYKNPPAYSHPAGCAFGAFLFNPANSSSIYTVVDSGSFYVLGYQPLPSWTIGDILSQLVQEALEYRGVTSFGFLHLGFDHVLDSYSRPWAKDGTQWLFDIGEGYDSIVDKLSDNICEIWVDETVTLQAARRRGYDRAQIKPPLTYEQLILSTDVDYLWNFVAAAYDVENLTSAGTTTTFSGFLPEGPQAGRALATDAYNPTMPSSKYTTSVNTAVDPTCVYPATAIPGVFGKNMGTAGYGLSFVSIDDFDPTDVGPGIPITGGQDFCLEFIESDAFWKLTVSMYQPDTPTGTSFDIYIGVQDVQMSSFQFGTQELVIGNLVDGDFYQSYISHDHLSHHWVLNFFNAGSGSQLIIYRDGVEVASTTYDPGWIVSYTSWSFVLNGNASTDTDTTRYKPSGGIGMMALYQHILEEDDIYAHWLAMYEGLKQIEPVILSKGRNIQAASSTVDFAGKTVLVTRSNSTVAEVYSDTANLNQYGRIEGYYDGSSKTPRDARRVATGAVAASLQYQTSNTLEIANDYVPWRDFGVGDWILAPGDYGATLVRRRVVALSVSEDSANGKSVYAIEIDSLNNEESRRLALWMTRTLPSGSLSGLISDTG